MPELPEVEVVKRSLEKNIINLIIKKVTINTNKLRYNIEKKKFNTIISKKILSIKRRSKYLIINLEKNLSILVHLGMTGKFLIVNKDNQIKKTSFYYEINQKEKKHNHVVFDLSGNTKLIYNDVRKFGFIKIIPFHNLLDSLHLKLLGPEPFSKKFNLNYFKKYSIGKKRKIKDVLMDQNFLSGLGNIYVNEILFFSKINPRRSVNRLSSTEILRVIKFTRKILSNSIRKGGSSISDFNDVLGKKGVFQQEFKVYSRKGKKCYKKNCLGVIKKFNISNRSTFYCKRCQK